MKQLDRALFFQIPLLPVLWFGLVGLLFFSVNQAYGHLAGITDTSIQIGLSKVKVVYTLPDDNLAELFPNENVNDMIPGVLMEPIVEGFVIHNNQELCPLESSDIRPLIQVQSRQFILSYQCAAELDVVDIEYRLFVKDYSNHENFTRISMAGKHLNFVFTANQATTQIPVKVTLASWGGSLTDEFVKDPNESFGMEAQPNYFPLGVEHILLGFDHLLFLFALLLLPLKLKQLLLMVTSFTVAHSITLAMAVFGWVVLPSLWVEAVIALSIVFVGLENVWELRAHKVTSEVDRFHTKWQRRVIVTFLFGLIHGFGFSYVLKEIGLGDQVASALLFFNLGVEMGQLLAVAAVFPFLVLIYRRWPALKFSKFCSLGVIAMGSFWLIERLSGI